jgi:hypothetical protein
MSAKHKQLKGITTTMQNQRNNKNPSELDRLMAAALSVAEAQMHRFGITIISYMMATPKGTRMVLGDASSDFDALATVFRLTSAAEAARVGVVSYQVRTTLYETGEQCEGILVSGQALGSICHNWFYPILRREGHFTGFGPKQVWSPGPTESPFTRLLPSSIPSAREREAAAKALASMTKPITAAPGANPH